MIRDLALLLIVAGMLATRLAAQPADRRISPPDPPTHRLPADAMMQTAASIGPVTLAAWGTTYWHSDTLLANRIVARVIRGGIASPDIAVSGPEARPYGYVQIAAAASAFLAIWNDRRADSPGVYARRIGLDGVPIGGAARLGPALDHIVRFRAIPGIALLDMPGGVAAMVGPDGSIDRRRIVAGMLDNPCRVGPDTSLIMLSGDTLLFFRSIFDSTPVRISYVRAVDSAAANTALVGVDDSGAVHVFFATIHAEFPSPHAYVDVAGYDVRVSDHGVPGAPLRVFADRKSNGQAYNNQKIFATWRLAGSAREPGCDNTGLVTIGWDSAATVYGNMMGGRAVATYIVLDTACRYRYGYDRGGYLTPATMPGTPAIARLPDTSGSAVRVRIGSDTIGLATASALRPLDIPQHSPALSLRGGELYCAWIGTGSVDTAMLGRWRVGSQAPAEVFDRAPMDIETAQFGSPGLLLSSVQMIGDALWGMNGAAAFAMNHVRADGVVIFASTNGQFSTRLVYGRNSLLLPDSMGWRRTIEIADVPRSGGTYDGADPLHTVEVAGYDPNVDEYLVRVGTSSTTTFNAFSRVQLRGVPGARSAAGWMLDSLPGTLASLPLVPAGRNEVLCIAGDTARRLASGRWIDTFAMPHAPSAPTYIRLLGQRFLRWYWSDSLGTKLRLEVYDLGGTPLAAREVAMLPSRNRVAVVQSRYDATIAVVHADSAGVRATLLGDLLATVAPDSAISSTRTSYGTPSAAFLRDTLAAAWSDTRNGGRDIYGASFAVVRQASAGDAAGGALRPGVTARVMPVPVREAAHIEIAVPRAGELRLELLDMRGAALWSASVYVNAGSVAYPLPLDDIAPGLYLLRYRLGSDAGIVSLPIVR